MVVVVAMEQDKSGTIDAIELQDVLCKLGFEASGERGSFRMEHGAHCATPQLHKDMRALRDTCR